MPTSTITTPIAKRYFFSQVFDIEYDPQGQVLVDIQYYDQTRCWLDNPTDLTCETVPNSRGKVYVPVGEDCYDIVEEELIKMCVPIEEHEYLMAKVYDCFSSTRKAGCIVVLLAEVTVFLQGRFRDLRAITDIVVANPNVEFEVNVGNNENCVMETYTLCDDDYQGVLQERIRGVVVSHLGVSFVPALKSAIESLPRLRLDSVEAAATIEQNPSCCICKDAFVQGSVGDDRIILLPCAHHFHEGCIIPWLETSHLCPLCRRALKTEGG